jgi:hypothetical protein
MTTLNLNDMLDTLARWLPKLTLSNGRVLWAPDDKNLYKEPTAADIRRGLVAIFGRDEYIVHSHEAHERFMFLASEDRFSFDIPKNKILECVNCPITGHVFKDQLTEASWFKSLDDAHQVDPRAEMVITKSVDIGAVYTNTCHHLGGFERFQDHVEVSGPAVSRIFADLALLMFTRIDIEGIRAIIVSYVAEYPRMTKRDQYVWDKYVPYYTAGNPPRFP